MIDLFTPSDKVLPVGANQGVEKCQLLVFSAYSQITGKQGGCPGDSIVCRARRTRDSERDMTEMLGNPLRLLSNILITIILNYIACTAHSTSLGSCTLCDCSVQHSFAES